MKIAGSRRLKHLQRIHRKLCFGRDFFLEPKYKELMKIMGLNMTAYWLSWFIIYLIIILIGCSIIAYFLSGEGHVTIKLCY